MLQKEQRANCLQPGHREWCDWWDEKIIIETSFIKYSTAQGTIGLAIADIVQHRALSG